MNPNIGHTTDISYINDTGYITYIGYKTDISNITYGGYIADIGRIIDVGHIDYVRFMTSMYAHSGRGATECEKLYT